MRLLNGTNRNQLQNVLSDIDANGQIAEIMRSCMRYGEVDHSPELRDAKKISFYLGAEIERVLKQQGETE